MRRTMTVAVLLSVLACSGGETPPREPGELPLEGTVAVEGAVLPYRLVGQGRPCIVYGSTLLYPRSFSERLGEELRCVHFDGRVFLPNAQRKGGVPYGVPEAVEDIEAVRAALGLDQVVLMGHSVVGLVVMAYAARYPEHVSHVVGIGAPPSIPFAYDSAQAYRDRAMSPGRVAQHEANLAHLDSLETAHEGRGFIPAYIANAALYWADSTYDATALFDGVLVNDTLFNDLQRTPFDWGEEPAPVDVPVFVALGRHDYVVTPNVWEGVQTPFRDLTVHVFDGAGHWPQLEDAPAFDPAVLEWIRSR